MLEYPEANVIAKQIETTLIGKMVIDVVVNKSPHKFAWFNGDPNSYRAMMINRRITDARSYGGMVEISFGDILLVCGDGTRITWFPSGQPVPEKHQLLLSFDDGSSLACGVQMYGGMWAFPKGTFDNPYYLGAKKAVPLTDSAFTIDMFKQKIKGNDHLSLKAFLATNQRFVGLGNGILQDILWDSGLHPKTTIGSLDEAQVILLHRSIVTKSLEMIKLGGRDTETDLFGNKGGYRTVLCSKTLDDPCPRCLGKIQKEAYLGGSIYFCPTCQPYVKKAT